MATTPTEAATHGQAPKGAVGCDQGHLQGRLLEGTIARDQGCCQQARPPAGMAGASGRRQHPQGRRSRSPPSGTTPAHKGGDCEHSAYRSYCPRGSGTCRKGGHSWERQPPAVSSTAAYTTVATTTAG
ncbi:hypothetical protein GW17_00057935 [Ensete ventricosum]|nr:hypothetical protein GW17_00057935 [Ensete ventricosum]